MNVHETLFVSIQYPKVRHPKSAKFLFPVFGPRPMCSRCRWIRHERRFGAGMYPWNPLLSWRFPLFGPYISLASLWNTGIDRNRRSQKVGNARNRRKVRRGRQHDNWSQKRTKISPQNNLFRIPTATLGILKMRFKGLFFARYMKFRKSFTCEQFY